MLKIFEKIYDWIKAIGTTPLDTLDMEVAYAQHSNQYKNNTPNKGQLEVIAFDAGRLIMRDHFEQSASLRHTYIANIEMLLYDSLNGEFDNSGNPLADAIREKIKKNANDIFTMIFYQD